MAVCSIFPGMVSRRCQKGHRVDHTSLEADTEVKVGTGHSARASYIADDRSGFDEVSFGHADVR